MYIILSHFLKGIQQLRLIQDKLRMNSVNQLDKFIKTEEIISIKGRGKK